jgi:hypothetical protein
MKNYFYAFLITSCSMALSTEAPVAPSSNAPAASEGSSIPNTNAPIERNFADALAPIANNDFEHKMQRPLRFYEKFSKDDRFKMAELALRYVVMPSITIGGFYLVVGSFIKPVVKKANDTLDGINNAFTDLVGNKANPGELMKKMQNLETKFNVEYDKFKETFADTVDPVTGKKVPGKLSEILQVGVGDIGFFQNETRSTNLLNELFLDKATKVFGQIQYDAEKVNTPEYKKEMLKKFKILLGSSIDSNHPEGEDNKTDGLIDSMELFKNDPDLKLNFINQVKALFKEEEGVVQSFNDKLIQFNLNLNDNAINLADQFRNQVAIDVQLQREKKMGMVMNLVKKFDTVLSNVNTKLVSGDDDHAGLAEVTNQLHAALVKLNGDTDKYGNLIERKDGQPPQPGALNAIPEKLGIILNKFDAVLSNVNTKLISGGDDYAGLAEVTNQLHAALVKLNGDTDKYGKLTKRADGQPSKPGALNEFSSMPDKMERAIITIQLQLESLNQALKGVKGNLWGKVELGEVNDDNLVGKVVDKRNKANAIAESEKEKLVKNVNQVLGKEKSSNNIQSLLLNTGYSSDSDKNDNVEVKENSLNKSHSFSSNFSDLNISKSTSSSPIKKKVQQ